MKEDTDTTHPHSRNVPRNEILRRVTQNVLEDYSLKPCIVPTRPTEGRGSPLLYATEYFCEIKRRFVCPHGGLCLHTCNAFSRRWQDSVIKRLDGAPHPVFAQEVPACHTGYPSSTPTRLLVLPALSPADMGETVRTLAIKTTFPGFSHAVQRKGCRAWQVVFWGNAKVESAKREFRQGLDGDRGGFSGRHVGERVDQRGRDHEQAHDDKGTKTFILHA